MGNRAKQDGEMFRILHSLVNLMNSANLKEAQLIKDANPRIHSVEEVAHIQVPFSAMGEARKLGPFLVISGWIYFSKTKRLIDRSCLLMVKDVMVARYCSKVAVWGCGGPEQSERLEKLSRLYKKGDAMLIHYDNQAIEAIKSLEPHCNLVWTLIGSASNPDVPIPPDFAAHLAQKRQDLSNSMDNITIGDFFDVVLTEINPHNVGVFFGLFRHWGHPFIN